jgi:hypothetical protein
MSDPNMDAADLHCDIQSQSFEDFAQWELWRQNNGLHINADMSISADEYEQACKFGSWPIAPKES